MRLLLAGLALVLVPSLAEAQCTCGCVRGRSIPICGANSLVAPICQQICTDTVGQSLAAPSISGPSLSGSGVDAGASGTADAAGLARGAGAAGSAGIDAAALKALLGR